MDPEPSPPARPSNPDRRLLEEAGIRLQSLLSVTPEDAVTWQIGARMDRPRSSVFPMQAVADGGNLGMGYYKVMHPSTKGERDRRHLRVERARLGLERTFELDERLGLLFHGEPIRFSRALAVDPDTLAIVTLGVSGDPFGSVLSHRRTPARAKQATRWIELAGRAARLIEDATTGEVHDRETERSDLLARRIERVEPWFPEDVVVRLRRRVDRLYQRAVASKGAVTFAHGDFSPTNLLVDEESIGLIDFEWVPRLRVFDLANLVFRLEFDTALPHRVVRPLVGAALRGYGEPGVLASPAWEFHRISNLLKVVRDGPLPWYRRRAGRVARAFAELESLAGTPLSSR